MKTIKATFAIFSILMDIKRVSYLPHAIPLNPELNSQEHGVEKEEKVSPNSHWCHWWIGVSGVSTAHEQKD